MLGLNNYPTELHSRWAANKNACYANVLVIAAKEVIEFTVSMDRSKNIVLSAKLQRYYNAKLKMTTSPPGPFPTEL